MKKRYKKVEKKYKAMEVYIEKDIKLLCKRHNEDLFLESGQHTHVFQICLTNGLPSSFEHPSGRICYKLICEVSPALCPKTLIIGEKTFTVLSILDLNLYRNLKLLNSVKISKTMRVCCFKCGELVVTMNTMQGAFVPGQIIPFGLIIENNSCRSIRKFYVYLIQEINILTHTSMRIVAKYKFPRKIHKRRTEIERCGNIYIPPVCQSFDHNLIRVNYFLMVNINSKDKKRICKLSVDYLTIPIVIGKIHF